jgi:hypothetical protein
MNSRRRIWHPQQLGFDKTIARANMTVCNPTTVYSSKPNPAVSRRIGHPLLDYLVGERE